MEQVIYLLLYFFVYAFLGWVAEVIYNLVALKRLVDPGFLRMPFLPIYGIGSVVIAYGIGPYVGNPFAVFALSAFSATVVEYLAHLLLDKLFHVQLWNYDDFKFNFQGRIALQMSLIFGVLALSLVYIIHPVVSWAVSFVPLMIIMIVVVVLSGLLLLDLFNVISSLLRVRLSNIRGTIQDIQTNIVEQLAKLSLPSLPSRKGRIRRVWLRLHNSNVRRLIRVFPNARRTGRKQRSAQ